MKQRQNIVFFFSDQQRADTLGCNGQPLPVTPRLDRFACEDAVNFASAFTPQPVCGPARACLLYTSNSLQDGRPVWILASNIVSVKNGEVQGCLLYTSCNSSRMHVRELFLPVDSEINPLYNKTSRQAATWPAFLI